jgi:hypothetical protein
LKSEKEIVLAYLEAHNAHDIERALSVLSPEIRFMMVGLWTREGLDEMRALEDWDAALKSQLAFDDLKVRQGRMDCRGRETNDWYQVVGIERVDYDSIKFEFHDGKISHIRAKLAPKSERDVDRAMNEVIRWALEAAPTEVGTIVRRGTFRYGQDQAVRWMDLLEKWRTQTG